jgi:CCR4-NOT transcription complex subunit 1
LDALLNVQPFQFALDVASLASRREYLNLDKWLADNVNAHGEAFLRAVMDFLEAKVSVELQRQDPQAPEHRTMPLNPQTIAIFIRVLRSRCVTNYRSHHNISNSMRSTMSAADTEYFTEIRNRCCQLHPRLMNLSPGSDAEPGLAVVTFSPEVEAEVENIYQQMYEENITVDQVISLLQTYKNSTNPREKEIFAFTLHTLFEEYKFFPSYPARELAKTAYLFGSVIQYQLVEYIPLGIAIRFVLDAIRNPRDTSLFKFGVQALSRFESRLPEWPQLCRALLALPHLQEAHPELAETARRALSHEDESVPMDASGIAEADLVEDSPALPFSSIQADPVLEEEYEVPEVEVSDKILFLINNLAPNNFESKTEEMKERFKDEYARWFANYLVDRRICTEPNNHQLYLRFLDAINSTSLMKNILQESYSKSGLLLNSEKTLQSAVERTTLKNLGSWLGLITLARNKPIKFRNISFKDLLIEGYDSSRLIVAIPFVCKILEHCAESTVFRPPNPWLMAVVSLLVELYHFAELKLNLKFEIEVLCKSLKIDPDKIEPTSLLRNRPVNDPQDGPPLPEFVADVDSLPAGMYEGVGHGPAEHNQTVLQLGGSTPNPNQEVIALHIEAILSNIPSLITINPQLAAFSGNPTFKRAVQIAVERAVREVSLFSCLMLLALTYPNRSSSRLSRDPSQ